MLRHRKHAKCLTKCLTEIRFCTLSQPPPPIDDPTVTTAVSILKHHRSKSRWSHIRTTTPSTGFTPSQFSQITLHLRNNPHLAFRFFQFTLQHSLCSHTISSYSTIIHLLSRSRHKDEAQEIIQAAFRKFPDQSIFETLVKTYRACDSAPFVFDLFIKACVDTKRVDQGVEVVRMLRCKNIYPKIGTCNDLIELVVKSWGCFDGYDLYREIFVLGDEIVIGNRNGIKKVVPDANTFNAIMVGFYREGLVEKVEEVWAEMVRVECLPDAYSYSVMMAAYCDDGRMDDATRVWEGMENKGVRQDVVTYNTMIGGFCGVGEMEKAEEFFQNMGVSGLESTGVTLEHLIKGYCKVGNVDSALLLYKDMGNRGFRPDSSTADTIITLLCSKSEMSRALEFYRVARKKHDSSISKKSYELLIEGLCAEGKIDEALRLQVDMVGKGYEPDSKMYDFFIDAYMDRGNEKMAEKLRRESCKLGFSPGKT